MKFRGHERIFDLIIFNDLILFAKPHKKSSGEEKKKQVSKVMYLQNKVNITVTYDGKPRITVTSEDGE